MYRPQAEALANKWQHKVERVSTSSLCLTGEQEVMSFACKLLMHPFPRIRRITAELLYIKLVEQAGMEDGHPVLELLLDSPWDADNSEADATTFALQVARLLKVGHLLELPPN